MAPTQAWADEMAAHFATCRFQVVTVSHKHHEHYILDTLLNVAHYDERNAYGYFRNPHLALMRAKELHDAAFAQTAA